MEQNNNNTLLRVNNLQISYGQIRAVESASFYVQRGEIVSLIGSNGAGKSTILNSIIGLHPPVSGSVNFDGVELAGQSSEKIVKQGVAMVPEGRGVLASMSILENLQLGAYHYKGDIQKNLQQVFARFPILKERQHQAAGTLSGGEQQQLVIGRALMSSPKLLLLDEPSLALAPVMVDRVFQTLKELKEEGLTILLSEQNARKALKFSDRGYVIDLGNITLSGPSEELLADPRVQAAYLGGSAQPPEGKAGV